MNGDILLGNDRGIFYVNVPIFTRKERGKRETHPGAHHGTSNKPRTSHIQSKAANFYTATFSRNWREAAPIHRSWHIFLQIQTVWQTYSVPLFSLNCTVRNVIQSERDRGNEQRRWKSDALQVLSTISVVCKLDYGSINDPVSLVWNWLSPIRLSVSLSSNM